jgi:SanA protein
MTTKNADTKASVETIKKRLFLIRQRFKIYGLMSLLILSIFLANFWIEYCTKDLIYTIGSHVPQNKVGLVLGCSSLSPSFDRRIKQAAQLYKLKRISHLLVSGDNGQSDYNEPEAMRNALIKLGVDKTAITLDYAGFRSLDSIIRAKEIFGLQALTIITSDYHISRALFIAQRVGIKAYGAPSPCSLDPHFSTFNHSRERLARFIAVIDTCFINRKPRYLGPKEAIK